MRTARAAPALAAGLLVAALAPCAATALVREERTGPVSGLPLTVEPAPPYAQLWLDAQTTFDGAPLGMTLSDGQRWRRDPLQPRWGFSGGLGLSWFAAALHLGAGTVGVALQADPIDRGGWKLGVAAAARAGYGGGWDLSLVPVLAIRRRAAAWLTLVPFGAVRVRWARTSYEVQGWSDDLSSPFASAITRDVAVALMAGVAAVTRLAELRLTAGWEVLAVDRLEWQQRPTGLARAGGPFAVAALRLRLGSPR